MPDARRAISALQLSDTVEEFSSFRGSRRVRPKSRKLIALRAALRQVSEQNFFQRPPRLWVSGSPQTPH
jgi:hypothetical protein